MTSTMSTVNRVNEELPGARETEGMPLEQAREAYEPKKPKKG